MRTEAATEQWRPRGSHHAGLHAGEARSLHALRPAGSRAPVHPPPRATGAGLARLAGKTPQGAGHEDVALLRCGVTIWLPPQPAHRPAPLRRPWRPHSRRKFARRRRRGGGAHAARPGASEGGPEPEHAVSIAVVRPAPDCFGRPLAHPSASAPPPPAPPARLHRTRCWGRPQRRPHLHRLGPSGSARGCSRACARRRREARRLLPRGLARRVEVVGPA